MRRYYASPLSTTQPPPLRSNSTRWRPCWCAPARGTGLQLWRPSCATQSCSKFALRGAAMVGVFGDCTTPDVTQLAAAAAGAAAVWVCAVLCDELGCTGGRGLQHWLGHHGGKRHAARHTQERTTIAPAGALAIAAVAATAALVAGLEPPLRPHTLRVEVLRQGGSGYVCRLL